MNLELFSELLCSSPIPEQLELIKRLTQDTYKQSLYMTCKSLLGYKDITEVTHMGIIRALESANKRKLIVVPRGCFKSSIGVVGYSIWLLLNNPNLRILIDSELYSNSSTFLREIKGHLMNESITELFGQFESDMSWNESEIIIKQRTRNLKEGSITCSGIGAIKVGQHYDVIIMDDMNSNKNSATPEGRQKVIDHYRYTTSILEPKGTLVVIGTRYSADDLIGFIMSNEINGI